MGVKLAFDDIVSGLNLTTVKTANRSGRHLFIPLPTGGAEDAPSGERPAAAGAGFSAG